MDQQLPTALQAALYLGSISITILVPVLIVQMLQFRRQIERVVQAVEELKAEASPLVLETRVVLESLKDFSGRVQRQWMEVEEIIDAARTWSERVNHLVEGIASVVEPPILTASHNLYILRKALVTFVQALSKRKQQHQSKVREV